MPSKGIDIYGYVCNPPFGVTVTTRGQSDVQFTESDWSLVGQMQSAKREMDSKPLGTFEKSGNFVTQGKVNGAVVFERNVEINPYTGNLASGNLNNMLKTPSVIVSGKYAVSYGFCDTWQGFRDQSYTYVTNDYSNWMGEYVNASPAAKDKSFGLFVLPGSHDCGMFRPMEARVSNLANTQKDDITTQLRLGIRYFDSRPGYNTSSIAEVASKLPGGPSMDMLYHQHGEGLTGTWGYGFGQMLKDVIAFLSDHPGEIVVVNTNTQGFSTNAKMKPTFETLQAEFTNALAGSNIHLGGRSDLTSAYGTLISQNKRLIWLDSLKGCRDSYTDTAYATLNPQKVIDQLAVTLKRNKADDGQDIEWTVLQLQGTATSADGGTLKSIFTFSDASSLLLYTKGMFDNKTYPWVVNPGNVANQCGNKLLVLLNDFADNALVSHCYAMTKQRADVVYSNTTGAGLLPLEVVTKRDFTTGWTALVPFIFDEHPYYLDYKVKTGAFNFQRFTDDGASYTLIKDGKYADGWTAWAPFTVAGKSYYLNYNQASGVCQMQRLSVDGSSVMAINAKLAPGFTSVMPFYVGGRPHFLAYNSVSGRAQFVRIDVSSDSGHLTELSQDDWTSEWTAFVPFVFDDAPYYLNYKSKTGAFHFQRITDDGAGYKLIKSGECVAGWTAWAAFMVAGKQHCLNYNQKTGAVQVQQVSAEGLLTVVASGTWTSGFTSIMPYYVGKRPQFLAYNVESGKSEFFQYTGSL